MNRLSWVFVLVGTFLWIGPSIFATETGVRTLAQANNKFGLSLLKASRSEAGKNQLISPLSAYQALSMVSAGASGQTKSELVKLLNLEGIAEESLESANRSLLKQLREDKYVETAIANSLWVRESDGVTVNSDYRAKIFKTFEGEVRTEDFNEPSTVQEINRWASKKTKGKIPEFIKEISSGTEAILLNATYFKGAWANEFAAKSKGVFNLENGTREDVDQMVGENHYQYVKNNELEAITLPYKTLKDEKYSVHSTFYMAVILPNSRTSMSNFLSGFNSEKLAATLSSLKEAEYSKGTLTMPKFSFRSEVALKESLQALGVSRMFSTESELLGILESKPLMVSKAGQATYISVDEKGTEAAAVTGISAVLASAQPIQFNMVVDRPFLFVIQEESTGAILFMGTVANPAAP